jgi:hypothetical protein
MHCREREDADSLFDMSWAYLILCITVNPYLVERLGLSERIDCSAFDTILFYAHAKLIFDQMLSHVQYFLPLHMNYSMNGMMQYKFFKHYLRNILDFILWSGIFFIGLMGKTGGVARNCSDAEPIQSHAALGYYWVLFFIQVFNFLLVASRFEMNGSLTLPESWRHLFPDYFLFSEDTDANKAFEDHQEKIKQSLEERYTWVLLVCFVDVCYTILSAYIIMYNIIHYMGVWNWLTNNNSVGTRYPENGLRFTTTLIVGVRVFTYLMCQALQRYRRAQEDRTVPKTGEDFMDMLETHAARDFTKRLNSEATPKTVPQEKKGIIRSTLIFIGEGIMGVLKAISSVSII